MIIWANHNMRASVYAMERVCKDIYDNLSIKGLKDISTVKHVFELQNESELKEAEKKYLFFCELFKSSFEETLLVHQKYVTISTDLRNT